jgi:hypothetical protein
MFSEFVAGFAFVGLVFVLVVPLTSFRIEFAMLCLPCCVCGWCSVRQRVLLACVELPSYELLCSRPSLGCRFFLTFLSRTISRTIVLLLLQAVLLFRRC